LLEAHRVARIWVLAVDYRRAPEYPFPAAVEDALAGYAICCPAISAPGRIAIAGDSVGGGLVVAAMLRPRPGKRRPSSTTIRRKLFATTASSSSPPAC
jgi:acetyl esterase/lipase